MKLIFKKSKGFYSKERKNNNNYLIITIKEVKPLEEKEFLKDNISFSCQKCFFKL